MIKLTSQRGGFMRFIFIAIVFIVTLSNCSMVEVDNDWYNLNRVPKELTSTSSNTEIFNWVIDNIDYKMYANGFHSAQQTLNEKIGNCANMSLLALALVYNLKGIEGELVYCNRPEGLHYTVRINHKIIEPGITEIYDIISFDDIAEFIYYRQ